MSTVLKVEHGDQKYQCKIMELLDHVKVYRINYTTGQIKIDKTLSVELRFSTKR